MGKETIETLESFLKSSVSEKIETMNEKLDSWKSSVSQKIDPRTCALAKVITKAYDETGGRVLLSPYDSTHRAAFGLMVAGIGFLYHIENATRGKVEASTRK